MQYLGESAYAAYLLLQPFLRNLNKFCQYILGKYFAKIYALGPWLRQHFVPNTDWTYSHEVLAQLYWYRSHAWSLLNGSKYKTLYNLAEERLNNKPRY